MFTLKSHNWDDNEHMVSELIQTEAKTDGGVLH